MSLRGRRILVTGATGGIGSEVAKQLSSLGASVALAGRSHAKLEQIASKLEGQGHLLIQADFSDLSSIESVIKRACEDKQLWGLVHCAGGGTITPLRVLSPHVLQQHMQVNFYAFIELVRHMVKKKYICPEGGSIVGISSFAAADGEQGQTAYAASKAAMDAAVRTLAYELSPRNIRINSIRPGMIRTAATDQYLRDMGQERFDQLVSKQLLGLGEPRDVAALCSFLLGEEGRFLTGRSIYLDGGRF